MKQFKRFVIGLGKYEEAVKKLRKAIEACERIFGREDLHTLAAMDNLASTYRSQGGRENTEKAKKLGAGEATCCPAAEVMLLI